MKTYQGSCHCGVVRFSADIDLAQGTLRCNCSICAKMRWWPAIVAPTAFRLLAGLDALKDYQFQRQHDHHFFCQHCGVHPFGTGTSPRWGAFYAINLACLDDASPDELAAAPVSFIDGKNDNWDSAPAVTGHL
ncbi:MAG: GFA family protein [Pseudomonadota bacterium]|nr:GFA family protein [Pseudomonadota bacterium]